MKSDVTTCASHTEASCNQANKEIDNEVLDHLMKTCSSYRKVKNTLAYIIRFVTNTRSNKDERIKGELNVTELNSSEELLFKLCQRKIEPNTLDRGLNAKEDENGVLRAHGRLENIRSLPREVRNPIILPRNHQLVNLLLKDLQSHT